MTNPAIRRATQSDAEALSAFAAAVFPLGCPKTAEADLADYISSELTPRCFLDLIEDANCIVLLAESTQRIVAYMVVVLRNPHPAVAAAAPAEFRKLYLDPAFQGTGLADALMHCALSILQAEGPRPIWLSVFSGNPRAITFYRRWGFRIVGTQLFHVGNDPQADFIMQRNLTMTAASAH